MRHQSQITRLALLVYCSLPTVCLLADDPFSSSGPFSKRDVAEPKIGVTRLTVVKTTPRSQTLAEPGYQSLEAKLSSKTAIRVTEMPLSEVMRRISEAHQIPVFPQQRALQHAKISLKTPVTIDVRSVSLRAALNLLLSKVGLNYIVKDEVIQYTTKDRALRQPVELQYQINERDASATEAIVKSVQELLDKEHKAPMPEPLVTTSKAAKLAQGRQAIVVSCNYAMHAIVRDYLSKRASADSRPVPR